MGALRDTAVPVPVVLGFCDDLEVNDAPFYVMEKVDGIIYRDALASGARAWWESQPADQRPLTPESYGAALVPLLKPLGLKILLEPGRFMVGNSGVLLSRVEHLKRGADVYKSGVVGARLIRNRTRRTASQVGGRAN